MVAQAPYTNAFAADGIVPEDQGFRTIAEYRSRLFTIPQIDEPLHEDIEQDEDMDRIMPVEPISTPNTQDASDSSTTGFLSILNPAEPEDVLRKLARQIDIAGLACFDPRYFHVLRMVPPMYLSNTSRAVVIQPISEREESALKRFKMHINRFWNGPRPKNEVQMSLATWHWATDLVAVATGPHLDRICAFNFSSGIWEASGSRVPNLAGVRCLAFRPFAGRSLALGCDKGLALLQGQNLKFLDDVTHPHILSLDWSPDGTKLAAASGENGIVRVWDIATARSMYVDRGSIVRFSPGGAHSYLFVSSAVAPDFRLWSCETWKCERWGSLSGPVVAATWSRDGTLLFFSTEGESAIQVMSVAQGNGSETRVVHTEMTALPRQGPGGTPVLIELDASGERLAVAYEVPKEDHTGEKGSRDNVWKDPRKRFAVALYATQLSPNFYMRPIGYVNGPRESGPPVALKFKGNVTCGRGAILSCLWKNGHLTFTQLAFIASHNNSG